MTTAATCGSGFELVNYNSGLCLGITGGLDDAPAVQWTCNGHPDQIWHWGDQFFTGSSWAQLVNGDGECLGVASGSITEGARVVGWSCLGTDHPDQYWQQADGGCGPLYSTVQDKSSLFYLGVTSNSRAVGASVVQWANQGSCNNQEWWFN
jgi:hypothetical protein